MIIADNRDRVSFRKKPRHQPVIVPQWFGISQCRVNGSYLKFSGTVADSQSLDPDQASNFQHPGLRIIDARSKTVRPGFIAISDMIRSENPAVNFNT